MSDMIMDTWEKRSNSYDIQSQQYSDATLGRERIYDTETGEVYYADNGWSDGYYGNRYQLVTPGSELYNLPVTGTISYQFRKEKNYDATYYLTRHHSFFYDIMQFATENNKEADL